MPKYEVHVIGELALSSGEEGRNLGALCPVCLLDHAPNTALHSGIDSLLAGLQ